MLFGVSGLLLLLLLRYVIITIIPGSQGRIFLPQDDEGGAGKPEPLPKPLLGMYKVLRIKIQFPFRFISYLSYFSFFFLGAIERRPHSSIQ